MSDHDLIYYIMLRDLKFNITYIIITLFGVLLVENLSDFSVGPYFLPGLLICLIHLIITGITIGESNETYSPLKPEGFRLYQFFRRLGLIIVISSILAQLHPIFAVICGIILVSFILRVVWGRG